MNEQQHKKIAQKYYKKQKQKQTYQMTVCAHIQYIQFAFEIVYKWKNE